MPDVTGLDEADAFNQLLDADLTPGERTDAFDADIPEGSVISTDPAANSDVERGRTVDYVVSRGPEPTPTPEPTVEPTPEPTAEPTAEPTPATVLVPDVTGVDEADALNQFLDADLTPGARTDAFDASVATGAVISTDPVANSEVDRGSTVDYTVSLGVEPTPEPTPEPTAAPTPVPTPATVSVPDVRGFQEADAINTLLDADLTPGVRSDAFDNDIASGLVIGTTPAATTEVDRRSTVDYIVSRGAEPTPEPTPDPRPNRRRSPPQHRHLNRRPRPYPSRTCVASRKPMPSTPCSMLT